MTFHLHLHVCGFCIPHVVPSENGLQFPYALTFTHNRSYFGFTQGDYIAGSARKVLYPDCQDPLIHCTLSSECRISNKHSKTKKHIDGNYIKYNLQQSNSCQILDL